MTPIGHVTLNSVEYKLKSLPVQQLASQMAPKVSPGESEYNTLSVWSAWVMENWTGGVGNTRPHRSGDGFLYGDVESRVKGQLILPQPVHHVRVYPGAPTSGQERLFNPAETSGYSAVSVGTGGYDALAWLVGWPDASTNSPFRATIWVSTAGVASTVRVSWYDADVMGAPGVTKANGSIAIPAGTMGAFPITITGTSPTNPDPDTVFYLVADVTSGGPVDVWCGTTRSGNAITYSLAGSTWTLRGQSGTGIFPLFALEATASNAVMTVRSAVVTSTDTVFIEGQSGLATVTTYKYDSGDDDIDIVGEVGTNLTGLNVPPVLYLDRIYIPTTGNLWYTDSAGANEVDTTLSGVTFVGKGNGYLWRANTRTVYYTSDGTTWTSVGDIGYSPFVVTGMAEMAGTMYVATGDGLYAVLPGDFVTGVGPWGSPDNDNGKFLTNWQGALYAIVDGRVWRYSQDGGLQDVWITKDDDLTSDKIGNVVALGTGTTSLFALVLPSLATGVSSIWALVGQSWHFVTQLPNKITPTSITYDRDNACLWVTGDREYVMKVRENGYAINPYNDVSSKYMPAGWVEWDWFRGNVRENDKDWESVTLWGNFSSSAYVKVYWKDDDSTNWELLGTVDSDGEELRWSSSATRPNSKKLKLGLLFITTVPTATPKVEGIRVKYHTMVKDWFRWTLPIDVSGGLNGAQKQEMINGEYNTLSATQIKSNVDGLAVRTAPFVMKDIDGTQYEVKVEDANFRYTKTEYNDKSSGKEWEGVYTIVVEQVTQGTYA